MLTGKTKELFEKWYSNYIRKIEGRYELINGTYIDFFNKLPFTMQYGVYVDFFESQGYYLKIGYSFLDEDYYFNEIFTKERYLHESNSFKTRKEAREQAIIKANEILNKTLKNENN